MFWPSPEESCQVVCDSAVTRVHGNHRATVPQMQFTTQEEDAAVQIPLDGATEERPSNEKAVAWQRDAAEGHKCWPVMTPMDRRNCHAAPRHDEIIR